MKKKIFYFCFLVFALVSWSYSQKAKFLPQGNKRLLIVGQDLGAVGGFAAPNNDGYYENVGVVPGGITTYTGLPYLNGLKTMDNWGAGDVCAQDIIDSPIYKNSVLVIGLSMKNEITKIANGEYDNEIIEFGKWVKSTNRPVFIRIGYEFDGGWNNYHPPQDYVLSFKAIVDIFKQLEVDNFATVWQSSGYEGSNPDGIMQWYPGDDYVDWLGYSHFHNNAGSGAMFSLSKSKNKPIMIAESTPKGFRISDPNTNVWEAWLQPFFTHIDNNQDAVRAIAYINVNWDIQPMWQGQGWGDTRVEANEKVKQNWLAEINKDVWLNSSDDLFAQLGFSTSTKPSINARKIMKTRLFFPTNSPFTYRLNYPFSAIENITLFTGQGRQLKCTYNKDKVEIPPTSTGLFILNLTNKKGNIFHETIVVAP